MSRKVLVSPRRSDVDLAVLDGVTVLGEPAGLLFSALLRLQLGEPRDGLVDLSARLPRQEGDAVERAMDRAERPVPGDRRTPGQRDCDRFLTVVERVLEAVGAVRAVRAQRAFRK